MNAKELRQKNGFRLLKNKYTIITVGFLVWMTFLDSNSWLAQKALSDEISKLKAEKKYYQDQIEADKKSLESLRKPEYMERFAREKYYMKKDDEVVFIVKKKEGG